MSNEIEYPCLMENESLVVCFSSDGVGHVVEVKKPHFNISVGIYKTDWTMGHFKPYEPPKEPVYEYLAVNEFRNNNYISAKFFTEEEAKECYRDMFVELAEWSKRERK